MHSLEGIKALNGEQGRLTIGDKINLLDSLAESEGYDDYVDMLEDAVFDGRVPSICPACGYTAEMEPDQDKGWCEDCQEPTVMSCLVLAGVI